MARLKNIEVDLGNYEIIRQIQLKSNKKVSEQQFGQRKNLFNDKNELIATTIVEKTIDLGALTQGQFVSFLGQFTKMLYRQFENNQKLYDLSVKFKGASRSKNRDSWNMVADGDFFYNIDLNSAYWQMCHQLGYITDDFYDKYQDLEEYKAVKRLCISFLARPNRKTYFVGSEKYTVNCDITALSNVYSNIRNSLYCAISDIIEVTQYIAYNIDGIYILNKDLKSVQRTLNKKNLKYKLTLCQKIDMNTYRFGNEVKKF